MEYSVEEMNKRSIEIQGVINEIIAGYKNIISLQEAAIWKSDALALQNLISRFKVDVIQFQEMEEASLKVEENVRKNLSFIKRFSASTVEKQHKNNIQNIVEGIKSIDVATSNINELIDEIPTNKAEWKQKILELITHKKELTVDKRTVNEEMRQIRTSARQAHASMSGVRGGTFGKMASYSRASITRGKENKLSPLESAKGEIENQLIETEKKIKRLKSFMVDEEIRIETQIRRCSYCGRRVVSDEVCPGCGSDKTTYELN